MYPKINMHKFTYGNNKQLTACTKLHISTPQCSTINFTVRYFELKMIDIFLSHNSNQYGSITIF